MVWHTLAYSAWVCDKVTKCRSVWSLCVCEGITSPDPVTAWNYREQHVCAALLLSLSCWAVEYPPQCRVSSSWWDHRVVPRSALPREPLHRPISKYHRTHVHKHKKQPPEKKSLKHKQIHFHTLTCSRAIALLHKDKRSTASWAFAVCTFLAAQYFLYTYHSKVSKCI